MKTTPANKTHDVAALTPKAAKRYVARGQTPRRRGRKCLFNRPSVEEWLSKHDGRAVLLKQAGAFADDESMPELLAGIYARRGRPEAPE